MAPTKDERVAEKEILKVLEACRKELRGHRILLFGSRARGTGSRLSDFDLGVDGETPLDLPTFYKLDSWFDEMPTLYKVDWVDLNRAPPALREQARREGRLFYEA